MDRCKWLKITHGKHMFIFLQMMEVRFATMDKSGSVKVKWTMNVIFNINFSHYLNLSIAMLNFQLFPMPRNNQ